MKIKTKNKLKMITIFVVLSIFVFEPIMKPIAKENDYVSMSYIGNNIYSVEVVVPSNKSIISYFGWFIDEVYNCYVVATNNSCVMKFYSENTTIEVMVFVYNSTGLETYYSFVYKQDLIKYLLYNLVSNVFIIVSCVLIIVIVYIIIKGVMKK